MGLNWRGEVAAYELIGGSAYLTLAGTVYDCCCDNGWFPSDAYEVKLEAAVSIGLGFGGHIVLPAVGRLGATVMGPQITRSISVAVSKDCCEKDPTLKIKILEVSGDVGGSFAAGAAFGGSVSVWAKYGISFELTISGRSARLEGIVGWKGGGEVEINTPVVNIHFDIAPWDDTWKPKALSTKW